MGLGMQERCQRGLVRAVQRGVSEAVDASSLLELRRLQPAGRPDVVGRILERFFTESEQRLQSLHAALARRDAPAIERAAHALKGIAGTVGAHEMGDLAVRLEQRGRQGSLQDVAQLVDELDAALPRARAIFEQVLGSPGPG